VIDETPVKSKLAGILTDLEERAQQSEAAAYHSLMRGLVIRIQVFETGFQVAIARPWPTEPSEIEENTILAHLAPMFHGQWHRTKKQPGRDGGLYNVSRMDYHR
jgi:hypothetical protein